MAGLAQVKWHNTTSQPAPESRALSETERARAKRIKAAIERGRKGPGWAAAMREIRVDRADLEPGVVLPNPTAQQIANHEFFRSRDARAAHRYVLDVDELRGVSTRIVPAGGERSREGFPHKAARQLAKLLDAEFVEFPGDHAGFATHPTGFAEKLVSVVEA